MPLLGCIADDFTGATDLASMLVRNGMRTVQLIGVPARDDAAPEADAIVVALKSRTAPVADAVAASRAALDWLRRAGCRQFFFKYCSTFDSTDRRQYRPGRRRAGRRARCRLRARLPRLPGQCAQRLSGPSLRRQRAAVRERHGASPAHADDRSQSRPRARATDRRHGRPGSLCDRRAGRRRDPRRDDRAEGARHALRDRRCGVRPASVRDRRGRGGACADHRRLRRGDGIAGEFPPRRAARAQSRSRPAAGARRRGGGARRLLLARDAVADRRGAGARADARARSARDARCARAHRRRRSRGWTAGSGARRW